MSRGLIYDTITQTIGSTPLIRLRKIGADLPGRVVVKHEGFDPFSSVKDRTAPEVPEEILEVVTA